MNKIIVLAISAILWGCTTPNQSLSGDYEIVGVECEKSLQEKLTDICMGKYIYRSRTDVPNLYKTHLMTEYADNELKWFDTPAGFMPEKSDYRLQASYGMSQKRGEIILFAPNHGQTIKFKVKYVGSHIGSNLLDIGDVIALYYNDNYIFNTYEMTVQTYGKRCDFINGELKYQATKKFQLVISVDLKHKGNRDDTKMLEFYEEWSSEPRDYTHYKLPAPIIVSKWTNNKYSVSYTDTSDGTYQRRFDFSFEISPDVLPK